MINEKIIDTQHFDSSKTKFQGNMQMFSKKAK